MPDHNPLIGQPLSRWGDKLGILSNIESYLQLLFENNSGNNLLNFRKNHLVFPVFRTCFSTQPINIMPLVIPDTPENKACITNCINNFKPDYHVFYFYCRNCVTSFLDDPNENNARILAAALYHTLIKYGAGRRQAPEPASIEHIEGFLLENNETFPQLLQNLSTTFPFLRIIDGQQRILDGCPGFATVQELYQSLLELFHISRGTFVEENNSITYPTKCILLLTGLMPAYDTQVRGGLIAIHHGFGIPQGLPNENAPWNNVATAILDRLFQLADCLSHSPHVLEAVQQSHFPQLAEPIHHGRILDIMLFSMNNPNYHGMIIDPDHLNQNQQNMPGEVENNNAPAEGGYVDQVAQYLNIAQTFEEIQLGELGQQRYQEVVEFIQNLNPEGEDLLLGDERVFTATPSFEDGQLIGVSVSNLGNYPFLPLTCFKAAIHLLENMNYNTPMSARHGNGKQGPLGNNGCPTDSIEGYVAKIVYGVGIGQAVFMRIIPIKWILYHSEATTVHRGYSTLNP